MIANRKLTSIVSVAGFLLIWSAISATGIIDPFLLPPPWLVAVTAYKLAITGELLTHMQISLIRAFSGFLLGSLIGIPLGILLAQSENIRYTAGPVVDFLRQIPGVAWIPLSILIFGLGEASILFIVAYATLFPVYLCTYDGVRFVDPILHRAALSLGAKPNQIFYKVNLPASRPAIFTGLWQGLGFSFRALVAAELVGAQSGLGWLIMHSQELLQTNAVMVGMITIAILGFLEVQALKAVQTRFLKWHAVSVLA